MARSTRVLLLAAGALCALSAAPVRAATFVLHGEVTNSAAPGGTAFVNAPLAGDTGTLSLTFDESALVLQGDAGGEASYLVEYLWSSLFACAPGSCEAGIDGAFQQPLEGLTLAYEDGGSFDTLTVHGYASLELVYFQLVSAGPGSGADRLDLAGLVADFGARGWSGSFEMLDQGGDGFGGSVVAAPEPATGALLGLGLAALACRRGRRGRA